MHVLTEHKFVYTRPEIPELKKIIKSPKINVTLIIDMKLLTTTADTCFFFLIETFLERIASKSRVHGFIYALQSVL